jgi:hypothetical protein
VSEIGVNLEQFRQIRDTPSSLLLDEQREQDRRREELLNQEQKERSVLERIMAEAEGAKSEEKLRVSFGDPKEVKREFSQILKSDGDTPLYIKEERSDLVNRGGRPKIAEHLKARDVRVTLKAHLFDQVEKRKEQAGNRSKALCDLLDSGLKYEKMRQAQSIQIKKQLKEFNAILSQIRIRNAGESWRASKIGLEENKRVLGLLFNKSLEIREYLKAAEIDLITLDGVKKTLLPKEIRELEFASNPSKMAKIVQIEEDSKGHNALPGGKA